MATRLHRLFLTSTALLALGALPSAAGPNGGTVVGGTATISGQGSSSVVVNQSSSSAVINWQTFNIGAGQTTTFVQPNSSSVALNRVIGGQGPSEILGSLIANGKVFLVNRDGFLFGSGAVINTASFLATTSDIKNEDFMAGKYNFSIPGNPNASIVNLGTITAANTGFAALVAPGVRNAGTISATLGTVALASGNAFTLDFYGDKLITLALGDQISEQVRDVQTGETLKSLVSNEGKLSANGGRVELTAAAARQVVDSVINNTGVIEANSVGTKNGMIVLGAATADSKPADAPKQTIKLAGKISAAGKDKGTTGGTVVASAEDIQLTGAQIDVSGSAGGGKVLIGGDWGGGHPTTPVSNQSATLETFAIPTATTVSVDSASTINASAIDSGNGGKVILWSDAQTTFSGAILARGGAQGGNGGFVETSSHGVLAFSGTVDTLAPYGTAGTLLLDPYNLTICQTDCDANVSNLDGVITPTSDSSFLAADTIVAALGTGNVTISTGGGDSSAAGDINVNSSIVWLSDNTLTLSAYRNINIAQGVTIANGNADHLANGNLILRADNTGTDVGDVIFACDNCGSLVDFRNSTGSVSIYFDPFSDTGNKYASFNPASVSADVLTNASVPNQATAYMLVNNVADLNLMGQTAPGGSINGSFALGTSFSATGFTGFSSGTTFNGRFDGSGGLGTNNTISDLVLTSSQSGNSYGLFPFIGSSGVVSNLTLANVDISAGGNTQMIGALAGQNNGSINNVVVSGGIVTGGSYAGVAAGGLVGANNGSIKSSSSAATVTVADGSDCSNNNSCFGFNSAGGLVGQNGFGGSTSSPATIIDSFATGNVSGGAYSFAGGLAGSNDGAISSSHASGQVTLNAGTNSTFFAAFAGGLVGQNGNGGTPTPNATITASYATGDVIGTGSNFAIGGLVGDNSAGSSITGSQAFGPTGHVQKVDASGGVVVQQGTQQNQFSLFSAGGLVGTNQGTITSLPIDTHALSTNLGSSFSVPSGDSICSQGALSCASAAVSIGSLGNAGGLVGQNEGIIRFAFATGNVTGAAGVASIQTNQDNTTRLGGLAGQNQGLIEYSFATGNVGDANVSYLTAGGLVGNNNGQIDNSFAFGKVSAGDFSFAGGLTADNGGGNGNNNCNGCTPNDGAGTFTQGFITLSGAFGDVSVGTDSIAGGLTGAADGSFLSTFAMGNVTGGANSVLGGLLGGLGVGQGPSRVELSAASGSVTGTGPNTVVGGLVGASGGTIVGSTASGAVSGTSDSILGGLVGVNVGLIQDSSTTVTATVVGDGANNVVGGLVGLNLGTIDPSTSAGNVSSGANSMVGSLVGANAAFVNDFASLPVPPPSTFPTGTISADSVGTGTVNDGTTTPQVGNQFPTSGVPTFPTFISTCDNGLCTILGTGTLTNPDGTTTPPPPDQQQLVIQNLVQDFILASLPGDVVNTQGLTTPPKPPGASGPTSLPPQFGAKFFTPPPLDPSLYVQNQVVVQIPSGIPLSQLQGMFSQLGLTVQGSQTLGLLGTTAYQLHINNGSSVGAIIQALAKFQVNAGAQANLKFHTTQDSPAPASAPTSGAEQEGDDAQYIVGKLHLPDVHRLLKGTNVPIAVIDSEIDAKHPDLEGAIVESYDAVGTEEKPHPHGTGMAGAIASHRRVLGMAPAAHLFAIHAFSNGPATAESTSFQILKGIDWAVSHGARVINMSFAGPRDPSLERALKNAHDKGVVLVAAAGNAGPKSPPLYPGADPHVIAVTATDVNDKLFTGANRGKYIAVAAPGVDILVPAPDASYQLTTGTSVASAEVSGIVALLLERNPSRDPLVWRLRSSQDHAAGSRRTSEPKPH